PPRLPTLDVAEVLAAIEPRVARLLERLDVGEGAEDGWEAQAPVLAGLASASVQATRGSGQRWADQARAFDGEDLASGRCLARANGFSLHAGVVVPAGQRVCLEQVCRYVLRPPVASDRLAVEADGRVLVTLRHGWADGTAVVALDPRAFLGRLAVLAVDEAQATPSEVEGWCPGRASICSCIRVCLGRGRRGGPRSCGWPWRPRSPRSNRRRPAR